MLLLIVGDVHGRPGRRILKERLPRLRARYDARFIIANGENAAGGAGLSREVADEIFAAGVDVITGGNHIWQHRDAYELLDAEARIVRPLNSPPGVPGHGTTVATSKDGVPVAVLTLQGRVFMPEVDDPFRTVRAEIEGVRERARVIVLDFHAEATSEKIAMGWYLDGKISALIGTHTHVQTADERILPQGTAYISDVGMTGPRDGVIGMDRERILERFLTALPVRFEVASGPAQLNAVAVDVDEETGKARRIERILELDGRAD